MKDERDQFLDDLFRKARLMKPDTAGVEEFFETRLLARLRERREARRPWYELAWRSVPAFALFTVILAVCSITIGQPASTDLFAAISSGQEEYLTQSIMSGE